MVEVAGEHEDGGLIPAGRTYREAPEVDGLVFARGWAKVGSRVDVRITNAVDYDLFGTIV